MKAAVYRKYGPPEVCKIEEVTIPIVKPNDILIRVKASTVNRTDAGFRSAEYVVSRLFSGIWKPKLNILGCEFAGIVEQVGKEVTSFKIGDAIFGYNDSTFGGHAEFICLHENSNIALIPSGLSFENAAPILEGSHYALCDLRAAKVKIGSKVLINGATGSIGSAAVQLCKHLGANVTAVCATANIEKVKSLGADKVIDYLKEDFSTLNEKFDFVFDAVGKNSYFNCKKILTDSGIYISTELGKYGSNIYLAIFNFLFKKKVLFPLPSITKDDVLFIKTLIENGEFMPLVDRTYKLDEIVEAYRYVETGQKIGNVVLIH